MGKKWWETRRDKNVQHVKIYLPCNFEVNPITHFGVLSLFSSNFQHFNTFRPLFQKLLEINVKFTLLQNGLRDLLQNCLGGRSWHVEHVCSVNLTFISNSFWNKGRKVLKCWKFDEKGKYILILFVLYFKNY
jgi:hypothetical protein